MKKTKTLNSLLLFTLMFFSLSFDMQAQIRSFKQINEESNAAFIKGMKKYGYDCASPYLIRDIEQLQCFASALRQLAKKDGFVTKQQIVLVAQNCGMYGFVVPDTGHLHYYGNDKDVPFGTRTYAPNGVSTCPCENAVRRERKEVARRLEKLEDMDSNFFEHLEQAEAAALRYKQEFMKCGKKVYVGLTSDPKYSTNEHVSPFLD